MADFAAPVARVLQHLDASMITGLTRELMLVPSVTGSSAESEIQHSIPTLHYGPGNGRDAHAPYEVVPIDETLRVAQTLVVLLDQICPFEL